LLNILIAYPYLKGSTLKTVIEHQHEARLLLDSGAFTAWRAGKTIDIDDYCRFLDTVPVKPWRYFTLDVIGDPAGSMKNYETMLQRGYKPIPIFTRGEDPAVLEDYYKTSDVVGIGGLVGTKGNKGFINGIMQHVGDRKVHWLGFTRLEYLKFYRPYSCDTASWENGAKFAYLSLYVGRGQFIRVNKREFDQKPSATVIDAIRRLGHDPYLLRRNLNWCGGLTSLPRMLGAASVVALSADMEKNIGTKYFISVASSVGLLFDAATKMDHELRRAA
jgi:hypothetical protein